MAFDDAMPEVTRSRGRVYVTGHPYFEQGFVRLRHATDVVELLYVRVVTFGFSTGWCDVYTPPEDAMMSLCP